MIASSPFRRLQTAGLAFSAAVLLYTVIIFYTDGSAFRSYDTIRPLPVKTSSDLPAFQETVEYFVDFPVRSPFKEVFGELGRRSRILRDWLLLADSLHATAPARAELAAATEQVALSLFPFLETYVKPNTTTASTTPMADLRASFAPDSAGIVIPTGDKNARFASHLIASLRSVLGSTLPIQVVYAGDSDLSPANRATLASVVTVGEPLEFLDLNTIFPDDTDMALPEKRDEEGLQARRTRPNPVNTLGHAKGNRNGNGNTNTNTNTETECEKPKPIKHEPLTAPYFHFRDHRAGGGWAFKSFAALASRFEKVILLDADAVFLQPPETMFAQEGFQRTGVLLFHDRLLWKNRFADRHAWWHDQIQRPSSELQRSLVWTEQYAEEGDSGAVVLDKNRVDVLVGLLHTCWQNTYRVREEVTYKMLYGDKESWWMGQELAGAPYAMEEYYGAMVGWEKQPEPEKPKKTSEGSTASEGKESGESGENANKSEENENKSGESENKSEENSEGQNNEGQSTENGQSSENNNQNNEGQNNDGQDGQNSQNSQNDQSIQSRLIEPVKVCSFVIAHVDQAKKLLWYNGSLMKNKARMLKPAEYEVPQQWMVGGVWHKGARKQDMSCMSGAPIFNLTDTETGILQQSIDLARQIDGAFA